MIQNQKALNVMFQQQTKDKDIVTDFLQHTKPFVIDVGSDVQE